jgi:hypothetical protein
MRLTKGGSRRPGQGKHGDVRGSVPAELVGFRHERDSAEQGYVKQRKVPSSRAWESRASDADIQ